MSPLRPPQNPKSKTSRTIKHGTRHTYCVKKCRCPPCREASRRYDNDRTARFAAARAEATPTGDPVVLAIQRGGMAVRIRFCPGVNGNPCVGRKGPTQLQKREDVVCRPCVLRSAGDVLVDAAPAREHIAKLRKARIGYLAIEDASGVSCAVLQQIAGGAPRIRRSTAKRILEVDEGARPDHGLVTGEVVARMREQLADLVKLGFRQYEIARLLGSKSAIRPNIGKTDKVFLSTVHKVERAWKLAKAGKVKPKPTEVPAAPIYRQLRQLVEDGWITQAKLERRVGLKVYPETPKKTLPLVHAGKVASLVKALHDERNANEEAEKEFDRHRFALARTFVPVTL